MRNLEQQIADLKETITSNNESVLSKVNNLYTELEVLNNIQKQSDNETQLLIDKINLERQQLEEKSKEMDSFKNVSLIKMMDKQVDEKNCKIKSLEKQYKMLEKKYKDLHITFNEQKLDNTSQDCNDIIDPNPTLNLSSNEDIKSDIINNINERVIDNSDVELSVFEEYEEEIDNKIYLFTRNINGEYLFYKKLKSGKISKKSSGNFTEIDGELECYFNQ